MSYTLDESMDRKGDAVDISQTVADQQKLMQWLLDDLERSASGEEAENEKERIKVIKEHLYHARRHLPLLMADHYDWGNTESPRDVRDDIQETQKRLLEQLS
jgi:isocitrate dehydrogenase kinase/phosphatase